MAHAQVRWYRLLIHREVGLDREVRSGLDRERVMVPAAAAATRKVQDDVKGREEVLCQAPRACREANLDQDMSQLSYNENIWNIPIDCPYQIAAPPTAHHRSLAFACVVDAIHRHPNAA